MASEVDPHRWISWVSLPILWIHCLLVPTLVLAILSVSLVFGIAWVVFGPQESREASMGALMLPAYFLAMPLELVTIGGGFASGIVLALRLSHRLREAPVSFRLAILTLLVASVLPFLFDWTLLSLPNYCLSVTTLAFGVKGIWLFHRGRAGKDRLQAP